MIRHPILQTIRIARHRVVSALPEYLRQAGVPWIAAIVCVSWTVAPTRAAQPPNVLLILADDVGQEVLGCYGGESYETPHLDHLAATGMQFNHGYSMPSCHPTRLTLLTGRYPFRQQNAPWGSFPETEIPFTLPRLLANAGYATAVSGKWQLVLQRNRPNHPAELGFDSSDVFGWHEGPRYYEPLIYRNGSVREDTLGHYGPDLYVRSLVDFMKAHRDGPFFAYYSMALCHDVTDDLEAPVPHGPFGRYDSYPEMVAEMDRNVGRLISALEALKLRDNTLVLFVGDNGTPRSMIVRADGKRLIRQPVVSRRNGQDVPGGKGTLLDRGTSVPLIANWPGQIEEGQVVDDLVDMSDFLPTMLDLAGASLPDGRQIDGYSFAARLREGKPSSRNWAYAEARGSRWVRTTRWKLYEDGRLFDMATDSEESSPIAPSAESPDVTQIRTRLQHALTHELAPPSS